MGRIAKKTLGVVVKTRPEREWFEATVDRWAKGEATYEDMVKAHKRMCRRTWQQHVKHFLIYFFTGRLPYWWEK